MGLFGKIKNMFYDEEIVEVPLEENKVSEKPRIEEVRLPKSEEVVEKPKQEESRVSSPLYTDRDIFKGENTFKFPVIDEEDEEPVRTRFRSSILDLETPIKKEVVETKEVKNDFRDYRVTQKPVERKPVEKSFKPSPVISPVYGVLDKNYNKEDIIERQRQDFIHNPSDMNYDSVRRKAYGTLEDELENTLSKISSKSLEKEDENKLEELENTRSIEDLLSEIEGNRNISIGEIEERVKDKLEAIENGEEDEDSIDEVYKDIYNRPSSVKEEVKEDEEFSGISKMIEEKEVKEDIKEEDGFDRTLEHDLFNLIDSMYEEREGE